MANYDSFATACRIGRMGEKVAEKILISAGFTVTDVASDKEWQDKDVDFLAVAADKTITVEVKTDTQIHKYNNICVETISNKNKERFRNGWFNTTQATYLFFYDTVNEVTHRVKTEELRQLYKTTSCRHKETYQAEADGLFPKWGEIALIPLHLVAELPHYRLYTKEEII